MHITRHESEISPTCVPREETKGGSEVGCAGHSVEKACKIGDRVREEKEEGGDCGHEIQGWDENQCLSQDPRKKNTQPRLISLSNQPASDFPSSEMKEAHLGASTRKN